MPFKDYLRYTVYIAPLALICAVCFQAGFFAYLDRSLLSMLSIGELVASCLQSIPALCFGVMGAAVLIFTPKLIMLKFKKIGIWMDKYIIIDVILFLIFMIFLFFPFIYSITGGFYFSIFSALLLTFYFPIASISLSKFTKLPNFVIVFMTILPFCIFLLFALGYSSARVELWYLSKANSHANIQLNDGSTLKAHPLRMFSKRSLFVTENSLLILNNEDIQQISLNSSGKIFCGSKHCLKNAWGK